MATMGAAAQQTAESMARRQYRSTADRTDVRQVTANAASGLIGQALTVRMRWDDMEDNNNEKSRQWPAVDRLVRRTKHSSH